MCRRASAAAGHSLGARVCSLARAPQGWTCTARSASGGSVFSCQDISNLHRCCLFHNLSIEANTGQCFNSRKSLPIKSFCNTSIWKYFLLDSYTKIWSQNQLNQEQKSYLEEIKRGRLPLWKPFPSDLFVDCSLLLLLVWDILSSGLWQLFISPLMSTNSSTASLHFIAGRSLWQLLWND